MKQHSRWRNTPEPGPAMSICFGHTYIPWHREVDGIHFVNTGRGILAGELPAEFADYLSTGGKRLPAGSG